MAQAHKYDSELCRLASFVRWPQTSVVSSCSLARLGFYATGSSDEVVCFFCHAIFDHFRNSESPERRHRQFAPQCAMVNGTRSSNVPLELPNDELLADVPSNDAQDNYRPMNAGTDMRDGVVPDRHVDKTDIFSVYRQARDRAKQKGLFATRPPAAAIDVSNPDFDLLRREAARFQTFTNFPPNAPVQRDELAKAGFFHVGPRDRVQCAFCRGLLKDWAPGDTAMSEHQRHFRDCPFVTGRPDHGNIPIEIDDIGRYTATARREQTPPLPSIVNITPEVLAAQPTFQSLTTSYKFPQFANRASRLQTFRISHVLVPQGQTIDTLVDAGFFHSGTRDNVTCFSCGVCPLNWRPLDDPWQVHRQCPHAMQRHQQQQQTTIHGARLARHLNEPMENQLTNVLAIPNELTNSSLATTHHDRVTSSASATATVHRVDNSTAAAAAGGRLTSSDPNPLRSRRNKKKKKKKTVSADDAVANASAAAGAENQSNDGAAEVDSETEKLLDENRQLHEARTCRVCMDLDVNVVFLPCGHLVSCDSCAPALRNCAVCRSLIRGTVKVFLS